MNGKMIGGLLVLVLVIQAVSMVNISKKIGGLNDQQISILQGVNQIAGVGGSGFLEPDEPGGYTISYDTFYLYGRCTTTTVSFNDQGGITGVTTTQGTTNGDHCDTVGFAQTNEITNANSNFKILEDGGISIANSKDVVKTQFRINKSR